MSLGFKDLKLGVLRERGFFVNEFYELIEILIILFAGRNKIIEFCVAGTRFGG